ncbi:MAG: zinc-ribbon domain-containing protein [Deltaproteobacteria bacterium]|nr:zinc-ribbon domain-containing protein [Deltaproteobacteria bacterium]
MIIQCDQCQSKFKLDDSKITEKGAKVRCSKCKHIFTVKKEAPPVEEKQAPSATPPVEKEAFKESMPEKEEESQDFGFEEEEETESKLPGEEDIFGEEEEEDLSGFGGGLEEEEEDLTWGDLGGEGEGGEEGEGEEDLEDDFEINEEDFGLGVSREATPGEPESEVPGPEAGPEGEGEAGGFGLEGEGEAGGFGLEGEGEAGGFGLEGEGEAGGFGLEGEGEAGGFGLEGEGEAGGFGLEGEGEAGGFGLEGEGAGEAEAPGFGDLDLDASGELETETAAPEPQAMEEEVPQPPPPRPEWEEEKEWTEEETPVARKKKGTSPMALVLLLIIALGGGGYYLATSGRDMNIGGYNVGEVIDNLLAKAGLSELGPQGQIEITNLNGYYLQTDKNDLAFVIEGKAVNKFNGPRNFIKIRAGLYDGAGKVLMQQDAYCGNIFSKDDIASFTRAKVRSQMKSRLGKGLINSNIAPGSDVPFMVILYDIPDALAEFDVQVLGSEDAMQKIR